MEDGVNLQNWLLCVEMLPAAIFMLFAFPYAEYAAAGGGAGGNIRSGNITHAISIRDVVTDTVHQFAPAYHDYVLYSDGTRKAVAAPPKSSRFRASAAGAEGRANAGGDRRWWCAPCE